MLAIAHLPIAAWTITVKNKAPFAVITALNYTSAEQQAEIAGIALGAAAAGALAGAGIGFGAGAALGLGAGSAAAIGGLEVALVAGGAIGATVVSSSVTSEAAKMLKSKKNAVIQPFREHKFNVGTGCTNKVKAIAPQLQGIAKDNDSTEKIKLSENQCASHTFTVKFKDYEYINPLNPQDTLPGNTKDVPPYYVFKAGKGVVTID